MNDSTYILSCSNQYFSNNNGLNDYVVVTNPQIIITNFAVLLVSTHHFSIFQLSFCCMAENESHISD